MLPTLLDNPLIVNNLFYPRADSPGSSQPNVSDGSIPVADGVALGYRLYRHAHATPVILYFHGNGEIASDYDNLAPEFLRAGASLLVVDYRGYGWSGGKPLVSTLLTDAEKVVPALPGLLGRADAPLFVMGRSLGSAPAVHLAAAQPAAIKGLIIESGFAHEPSLFRRLQIPDALLQAVPSVFGNEGKMANIHLPLLVIHGQRDTLIPPENGQALYDASPSAHKTIVTIPGAGHNDLLYYGMERYFAALTAFVREFAG